MTASWASSCFPPTVVASVRSWPDLQRGDLVEIEGRTERGGFAPNIRPLAVHRLGRSLLARPKQIPFSPMLTRRHHCDYVELYGLIPPAPLSSDPQMHTLFPD